MQRFPKIIVHCEFQKAFFVVSIESTIAEIFSQQLAQHRVGINIGVLFRGVDKRAYRLGRLRAQLAISFCCLLCPLSTFNVDITK